MVRSYRGLGLVALTLLVVAPLTLFAVLSLFEDESSESIGLSVDGVEWTMGVEGAFLASRAPWSPGEVRSAIIYVRNGGPDPVDADVTVICRSTDELVVEGYLTVAAQVGDADATVFPAGSRTNEVHLDDLASDSVVPVTLTATFADTAPLGTTLDSRAVRLKLKITGARTQESGAPSLLDATGAQLWLAPILLAVAALVALLAQARRGRRPGHHGTRR
jgi:hypothetical protein